MQRSLWMTVLLCSVAACSADWTDDGVPDGANVGTPRNVDASGEARAALVSADGTCTATFISCDPPTCGGFDSECENLAEWAEQCDFFLDRNCGP